MEQTNKTKSLKCDMKTFQAIEKICLATSLTKKALLSATFKGLAEVLPRKRQKSGFIVIKNIFSNWVKFGFQKRELWILPIELRENNE